MKITFRIINYPALRAAWAARRGTLFTCCGQLIYRRK